MPGIRENGLHEALGDLLSGSDDIEAAAVVGLNGNLVASLLSPAARHDRIGAMCAALYSLGERTANELGKGELVQIFIEGGEGYVFVLSAGSENVLVTIVRKGGKLGDVLLDIRNAIKRISSLLGSKMQVK